ncbi:MAG TPA: hypothetical protein EYQ83_04230, partial [Acidobacteria bacterium]|nr:hypothetical protein [Acidobacteriota bacterium]
MTGTVSMPSTIRTSTIALSALFLVATAALAQPPAVDDVPMGPVRVETLELEPTVVKTGDLILQRYRLRFPDLVAEGQEIIILEDRVAPEALPVHPFEGVSLTVDKDLVEGEHIWEFEYGFRLVDPNKMTYLLPNFSFYYLVRDLGEDIEDAEVQQVDGGQGLVRYVTSITDEPLLNIRDTIELGAFAGRWAQGVLQLDPDARGFADAIANRSALLRRFAQFAFALGGPQVVQTGEFVGAKPLQRPGFGKIDDG